MMKLSSFSKHLTSFVLVCVLKFFIALFVTGVMFKIFMPDAKYRVSLKKWHFDKRKTRRLQSDVLYDVCSQMSQNAFSRGFANLHRKYYF